MGDIPLFYDFATDWRGSFMHDEIQHSQDTLTLLDLREKYRVNILELAERSGVEPSVVYCMLLNRPVSFLHAFQVIEGLSNLVGVCYTLNTVDVLLADESV